MNNRVKLDLGFAYLVAETSNCDPKEVYIGLESKEGQWLQDLAVVGQQYHIEDHFNVSEIIPDKGVRVLVYADAANEDYTNEFEIDVWSPECHVRNIHWATDESTAASELPSEVVIPECELHPWIFSASKSETSDLTRSAIYTYLEDTYKCKALSFVYET